jgi:hypothetical protein
MRLNGGERVLDGVVRRVGEDDLLAEERKAVDDDGAFKVHGGPASPAERDDIQEERVLGTFELEVVDIFGGKIRSIMRQDFKWGDNDESESGVFLILEPLERFFTWNGGKNVAFDLFEPK